MGLLLSSTINITEGFKEAAPDGVPVVETTQPLIAQFIDAAIVIGALLFLVYLIIGAIQWVTSGGDKGKVEGARNKMIQAFIGLVVLVFAYGIYVTVLNFLDIDIGQGGSGSSGGSNWHKVREGERSGSLKPVNGNLPDNPDK